MFSLSFISQMLGKSVRVFYLRAGHSGRAPITSFCNGVGFASVAVPAKLGACIPLCLGRGLFLRSPLGSSVPFSSSPFSLFPPLFLLVTVSLYVQTQRTQNEFVCLQNSLFVVILRFLSTSYMFEGLPHYD